MGSNLGGPRLIPSMAGHFVSWKTTEQVELQCSDLLTQWITMFSKPRACIWEQLLQIARGLVENSTCSPLKRPGTWYCSTPRHQMTSLNLSWHSQQVRLLRRPIPRPSQPSWYISSNLRAQLEVWLA